MEEGKEGTAARSPSRVREKRERDGKDRSTAREKKVRNQVAAPVWQRRDAVFGAGLLFLSDLIPPPSPPSLCARPPYLPRSVPRVSARRGPRELEQRRPAFSARQWAHGAPLLPDHSRGTKRDDKREAWRGRRGGSPKLLSPEITSTVINGGPSVRGASLRKANIRSALSFAPQCTLSPFLSPITLFSFISPA